MRKVRKLASLLISFLNTSKTRLWWAQFCRIVLFHDTIDGKKNHLQTNDIFVQHNTEAIFAYYRRLFVQHWSNIYIL